MRQTRKEREATRLIRDIQTEVRHPERVLIKGIHKGQRDLIQTVTHHLTHSGAGTKVRTEGGDVWVVREINRGGIKYEATS